MLDFKFVILTKYFFSISNVFAYVSLEYFLLNSYIFLISPSLHTSKNIHFTRSTFSAWIYQRFLFLEGGGKIIQSNL
jgi:hypothetical protein